MMQAFLLGCLCALTLLPLRYSISGLSITWLLLLTVVFEEIAKSVSVVLVTEKNFRLFDQVIDGIEYAVTVAMGFAFVENIIYVHAFLESGMQQHLFWLIYFLRAMTTTFAHGVFSGVFGFAYANAYLLPDDFIPDTYHGKPFCCSLKRMSTVRYYLRGIWDVLTLHVLFGHVFRNKPSTYKHSPNHLILEGIMSAMYLHLLYDLLAKFEIGGQALAFLLPGFLLLVGWRLLSKFKLKRYRQIVHRKYPPHDLLVL